MKKTVSLLLLLALLSPLLSSCSKTEKYSKSFFFMNTLITLTLYSEDADLVSREMDASQSLLEELDALWTRHGGSGDVARINNSSNECSGLDPRTVALLRKAQEISFAVDGAFDFTLAPLSDLWESCAAEDRTPNQLELISALARRGVQSLSFPSDSSLKKNAAVQLDLGGIGKGAAISHLLSYLQSTSLSGGLITFGSNVAAFGSKPNGEPYRVSIRDPKNKDATVGTLTLQDGEILSVSGDYERFYTIGNARYHHIFDPSTGMPSNSGVSSASVICRDGALADALSTALLVMGVDDALRLYRSGAYDFEAILITSDGQTVTTDGLSNSFISHSHSH